MFDSKINDAELQLGGQIEKSEGPGLKLSSVSFLSPSKVFRALTLGGTSSGLDIVGSGIIDTDLR